jgi:hypothetical protein
MSIISRLFILAPLAMLFLSSCEPGEENTDAGSSTPRDPRNRFDRWVVANTSNHERLAAQDSVGRPPLPRNFVSDVEDVCPVHHEKMSLTEVPIIFEDSASVGTESVRTSLTARFPFGAEKICSSGNALLPGEPLTARVYQCASCIAARKVAEKQGRHTAASANLQ